MDLRNGTQAGPFTVVLENADFESGPEGPTVHIAQTEFKRRPPGRPVHVSLNLLGSKFHSTKLLVRTFAVPLLTRRYTLNLWDSKFPSRHFSYLNLFSTKSPREDDPFEALRFKVSFEKLFH